MIGILFAYLLDKNIRGTAIYQSVLYMPVVLSLAVVGFIWKGVMWSPSQGMFNVILGRTAQGDQIDWVGNAERIFTIHVPFLDYPARTVEELRRDPDRDGLETHRLRDGAVPRRVEER